jgi:hypothetical protein
MQEIAAHIGKNWRTADRYIDEIEKEYGTISKRVFREGTRGALKIVYWAAIENVNHSVFQDRLEQDILKSKRKEEFSSFEIFQFVDNKKKKVFMTHKEEDNTYDYVNLLSSAKKQILIFSGNLSFINIRDKKLDLFHIFENLVEKGVNVKIICRVDLVGKENIERALSLNNKYGKELIEIRHDEHPIRAVIVDSNIIRMKEVKEPTGKINELNKRAFIYYTIRDKDWVAWLSRIFWKKFSNSIDSHKRLEELNKIKIN